MWGKKVGSTSDLMVVGLAPGFYEDEAGEPFIGRSGKLLSGALEKAGLLNYYKTNTVKCYPGSDADIVDRSAVKACSAYLEEEIQNVRPRFVLALGNVAIQRFLGKGTVGSVVGKEQWSGKHGLWVLPLQHPAYILRSPGREAAWQLDLIRYGHLIRGDIPLPGKPPIRVRIVETPGDLSCLYQRLREQDWAFDFETNGQPWWHTDFRASCVGFAFDGAESTVLFLDHPDNPLDPRLCREVLRRLGVVSPYRRRIGHNAGMFDCPVWFRLTGNIPYLSDDTMVQAHLLDENEPKGLKWQGRAKLGWPDWDVELEQKTLAKSTKRRKNKATGSEPNGSGVSQPDPEPARLSPEDFAFYCGADTCATYLLRDAYTRNLQLDERLWNYYVRLEMPKVRALTQLVVRGIYVDKPRLARQWALAAQNWDAAKRQVPVQNPASAEQVAAWLFGPKEEGGLALAPLHVGKKHGSTQEEDINRLALAHPEVRVILPVRKWARYQTTYFRPVYEAVRDSVDGRYHPDIRVAGAERRQGRGENSAPVTGRLSSAYHTVPRPTPEDGPFVRQIFSAPEGFSLIEADLCLSPEARVLTADLRWVPAGSLVEGDELVGFDENATGRDRRLRVTTVEKVKKLTQPCYRITTDRGSVVASENHLWLRSRKQGLRKGESEWIRTADLQIGQPLRYFTEPWEVDTSWEGGYLAGFLDGEGYVSLNRAVGFGQNAGPTLKYVVDLLRARGFSFSHHIVKRPKSILGRPVKPSRVVQVGVRMSGGWAGLRLLGMIRPPRLLAKVGPFWNGTGTWGKRSQPAFVQSVEYLGEREVVATQTSTRTLIAEGIFSHNSQIEARFCAWAAAGKPGDWGGVAPRSANMLLAFRDNRNIYAEQAAQNIYGDPRQWQRITQNERQVMGKVPVLAMLYRISPKGLQEYAWREYQIDWTIKQAGRIWMGFHKLWPEFQQWHNSEERKLRARGWAQTPLGRYRRLPAALTWGKAAADAIQAGINSPIQGVASDWTQAALIILEALTERGLPIKVVGDVHDALQVETPSRVEAPVAKLVKRVFEVSAGRYLEPLGLRLPPGLVRVEVKVGNWGEGKLIV